jgi:glycosyltransferase involved in cell wall biosynthesis
MSDVMPYRSSVFSELSERQLTHYAKAFESAVREAVRLFQPDILHSHHLWIASAVSRECIPDLPLVTTCHSTCLRQYALCGGLGRTLSPSLRKLDRIMALSRFQKEEICDIHGIDPEQVEVVGGGYDDALFYHTGKAVSGPIEILYAGKLSRSKGVPWLLQALQRLVENPWVFHLVGEGSGSEKQQCLDLAAELGSRVILHGPLEHARLAALMRKAHIFVLPSFSEGLPLVLMEALASGCRLIATSLPGIREILGESPGSMIKLLDIPELETVDVPYDKDLPYLEDLLVAALRAGIAEVEEQRQPDIEVVGRVTAGFTWPQVFAKVERVYEQALLGRER